MGINFLDYDRQEHQVPLKKVEYDPHMAQETLMRAWQQANLTPATQADADDPSTWELVP